MHSVATGELIGGSAGCLSLNTAIGGGLVTVELDDVNQLPAAS
jgi:hypothetical protein